MMKEKKKVYKSEYDAQSRYIYAKMRIEKPRITNINVHTRRKFRIERSEQR
jgi:uncharacterized protein with FMN-binding domain